MVAAAAPRGGGGAAAAAPAALPRAAAATSSPESDDAAVAVVSPAVSPPAAAAGTVAVNKTRDCARGCRICGVEEEGGEGLERCLRPMRGCSCLAGAHLRCYREVARKVSANWFRCPECRQRYVGEVQYTLARERWKQMAGHPEDSSTRAHAGMEYAMALENWQADYETAQPLLEQVRDRSVGPCDSRDHGSCAAATTRP